MRKKRVIATSIVILALSVVIYFFYILIPKTFPNDELVIKSINQLFPEAKASVVQETIYLDERHAFVPFISSQNHYGRSFWVFEMYQWKLARVDTRGEPIIWSIKEKDPSTHYILWNMDPKDQLSHLDFYLLRDRGYFISNGVHRYEPKVQMKTSISLQDQSYGVMPFSEEWIEVIDTFKILEKGTNQNSWLFARHQQNYIGWMHFDIHGESNFPERSVNGSSYTKKNINLDFIRILNERDLESH